MIGPTVAVTRIRTNTTLRIVLVDQPFARGVERVESDERRGERRRDLRQRERPDRHPRGAGVVEDASGDGRGNALADDQRTDHGGRQAEVVDDAPPEHDRIDQKAGDDEEDRDEEGVADELQLLLRRLAVERRC